MLLVICDTFPGKEVDVPGLVKGHTVQTVNEIMVYGTAVRIKNA